MANPDEPDDDDAENAEIGDEFERHRHAIYDYLNDYIEEHDVDQLYLAHVLMDIVLGLQMTSYALSVEQPSVAGLKLELDRFRRDVDDMLREAKRGAEGFIRESRELLAEMKAEDGEGTN